MEAYVIEELPWMQTNAVILFGFLGGFFATPFNQMFGEDDASWLLPAIPTGTEVNLQFIHSM